MFKISCDLTDYGFQENENLRTATRKVYVYKYKIDGINCWGNFDFRVDNNNILTFDTDAYGADEYDLFKIAKIIYKMTKDGVLTYIESKED